MLSLLAASGVSDPILWSELGLRPGIELGFFTLRYYSLAYLLGVVFAYWHLSKMIKAPGAPMAQRHVDDLFFYGTLGVILGGRIGYALFYTGGDTGIPALWLRPLDLLKLWEGGMSFHGGVLGVLAAIAWVSWRGKLSFLRLADYVSVNVAVGMLLGRLANFVNGELWGRVTDVPWAMVFPGAGPEPRHPSQLYQAGLEGLAMILIMIPLFWFTRARYRPGLLVSIFAIGMGAARFVNEFFRQPDAQLADFAAQTGLSMGQWLTIPLIMLGVAVMMVALVRAPAASVPGKPFTSPSPNPSASAQSPSSSQNETTTLER